MTGGRRLRIELVKAVRVPVSVAFVRAVLEAAIDLSELAARYEPTRSALAVRITGDQEMRNLNRQFAGLDQTTDVLSFEGGLGHLGDLAISWPAVVRQSSEHGHAESTELALLLVHGLLHLLGWDHADAASNLEMSRLTLAALAASDITISPGRL